MRTKATLVGFSAILMWSFLALLTTVSGAIPPFQLTALTFSIGGLFGAGTWLFRRGALRALKQPWQVWALGCFGLCVYHVLYFFAVQSAPAVEASLIAYLWPLLIVLFSALLPGEKLKWHHGIGAVLGLLGAVMIITKGGTVGFSQGIQLGHVLALACAFIWSGYSVLSRRFAATPTDIVVGYCLVTAVVAASLHFSLETTVWPQGAVQWSSIVMLGLFPLGIGFYAWDFGVKQGDIMVLGAASYAAPLFSTLILIVAGYAEFSGAILSACLLITAGAVIAAKDMIFQHRPQAN
jgi:drug/metabolite transporter (DMT)-like permease